jgi:predicted nucleic acid-binding protein
LRFLVDTNVFSEMRKGSYANPGVQAWTTAVDTADLAMSVITLKEIEYGVVSVSSSDPAKSLRLRAWLDHYLLPRVSDRILPITINIARECALLEVPGPYSLADALIASTAIVHDLTVVTRNVRHFAHTGAALLNPWDA